MRKSLLVLSLVVALLLAGSAMASTINLTQGLYSASLTVVSTGGTGYKATLDLGGPAGYYTNDVAIHVSNSWSNLVLTSPAWASSGGGNVNQCVDSTVTGFFCAKNATAATVNGAEFVWTFNATDLIVAPGNWSVQYMVWSSQTSFIKAGPGTHTFETIFSQDGPPTQTPEPASLALLGAGLLGLGGVFKRPR